MDVKTETITLEFAILSAAPNVLIEIKSSAYVCCLLGGLEYSKFGTIGTQCLNASRFTSILWVKLHDALYFETARHHACIRNERDTEQNISITSLVIVSIYELSLQLTN